MPFVNKFKILVCTACLMLVGQGFALNCNTGTGWGDFLTEEASLVNGYYEIGSPEKLAWFACKTTHDKKNFASAKMKLTQDIDLQGKLFIPIAESTNGSNKFSGTIDGQGHYIRGLYIKGSEISNDLTSDVTGVSKNGMAGYAQNVGLVSVLTTNGKITNLVIQISDIYASSSAGEDGTQGSNNPISVGTLVGWMEAGEISNCVVEGNITTSGAENRVGGLAGNVWAATISDCVSKVSISASGKDTHVGGVVGALRKGKNVTLSSCVFDGDTLISTGGSVGGIVGNHENSKVNASNLYYTGDYDGVGVPKENQPITTTHTNETDLNSEATVCKLNKGTWDADAKTCSGAKSDAWSEGQSDISMNGSDGYKISFDANKGDFGSGAKTFKIFAKGATITDDEITIPTPANLTAGKKFAGWATTSTAADPTELGVADANKTLYAVWYDFYTVTFNTNTDNHPVSVPKHGHVSTEGFSVPSVYEIESEGETVKYYFTGWTFGAAKYLGVKQDPTVDDTLHLADIDVIQDTALFPVWTRAETYSVTFDATLHGKTHVRFVKKVNEGDKVEEPDDVVTNPGYSIKGWCTDANCSEGCEYDFNTPLENNLTLYADWEVENYAITYTMNGGTNDGSNPTSYTVESDDIVFADPTYEGNIFGGWFYDAGFTSPATGITTGSTTGQKDLYARWLPLIYTIEYLSGNEVSATIVSDKKLWGETRILKGVEFAFQREGYTQDGWSSIRGGALDHPFGELYTQNADLVLYPHWVPITYTITYNTNDGVLPNDAPDPHTYTIESEVTLLVPTRDNYDFAGWYDNVELTGEAVTAIAEGEARDTTFYAKWTAVEYTATYDVNGGSMDGDVSFTFTIESGELTLATPNAREGFTFDGWLDSKTGSVLTGTFPANSFGERTLIAQWTPVLSTITVTAKSQVFEYDGKAHSAECEVTTENPWGYTFTASSDEQVTDVKDDEVTANCSVVVKDGDEDITALFDGSIEYVPGTISVKAKVVNYGGIAVTTDENGAIAEIDGSSKEDVPTIVDVEVDHVVLNRTFPKGVPATVVLPFTIDTANVHGAQFYTVSLKKNENGLWVAGGDSVKTQYLTANTPYIVIVSADDGKLTFDGPVTLNTSVENNTVTDNGDGSTWTFTATYNYHKWNEQETEAGNIYGFAAQNASGAKVGEFVQLGNGAWIRPMRAFLVYNPPKQAPAPVLAKSSNYNRLAFASVEEMDLPESIDFVILDNEEEKPTSISIWNSRPVEVKVLNQWFDMNGRKLNGKPTTKGIYYYNGKRVFVK